MSSWGNYDNVTLSGTVTTSNTSDLVNGFGATLFLAEVNPLDYVTIASNKYQVQNVVSNTQLYLTSVAATNSANVKAFVQQGPKYVSNVAFPANNASIQNVYGVDRVEMALAHGASATAYSNATAHSGWNLATAWTANGVSRVKVETLVAMSKNFNANVNGYVQQDANDNTQYPNS